MPIEPGQHLLHYRLIEKIGEGGMGVVWKAADTTLGRNVAIKVLPEAFTADPERLARFQREAKVLASLNHPNIAGIFGAHEHDGVRFLAMELVAGEELSERVARGPLPIDDALSIARQIAEALEVAHDNGIVHRDLKPANVKLTDDLKVKVLDFGLAKADGQQSAQAGDAAHSPTVTSDGTRAGLILGTAPYMSPEQARGKPVDKRTDIWALGCVLFECLAGRKPFEGDSTTDVLAQIVTRQPDFEVLPRTTPGFLVRLLHRCLEKDARRRLRDAGELRVAIETFQAEPYANDSGTASIASAVTGGRRPTSRAVLGVVALALLLGLLSGFLLGRREGPEARLESVGSHVRPPTHTVVNLPDSAPLALGTQYPQIGFESPAVTLSPDGRHLVYVGPAGDGTRLYHRDLTRFEQARPIPGTEGAHYSFFSPSSAELGFLTQDRVKKVPLDGGAATTLCRASAPVTAIWIDDTIYFSDQLGFALGSVPSGGGECSELFHTYHRLGSLGRVSDVLPGGKAALVSLLSGQSSSAEYSEIWVVSLDGGEDKALAVTGFDARYLPSGHLVFASGGKLQAAPFDLEHLDLQADAVPVLDSAAHESIFGIVQLAVASNGTVAFVPGDDLALGRIAWVDRKGDGGVLDVPERVYGVFDLAPDGRRFALQVADVRDYIWLWDAQAGGRALASAASTWYPLWSPDGGALAFWAQPRGGAAAGIMVRDLRSGATRTLLSSEGELQPNSWARAGFLGISSFIPGRVGVMDASSPGDPEWVAEGIAEGRSVWPAALAPDGAWMAYGSGQVWLEKIEGDVRRQISTDGGVEPLWCRECDELFYRHGNRILASRITFEPELEIDPPRAVFEATDFVDTKGMSYCVSPDGQLAYYLRRSAPPARHQVHIIVNWFEELERLVPGGG